MDNAESRTIADVFNILDCWRHLPAFRLELQVAPFFALFLRDVMSWKFGVQMHPIVIPEFPLKITNGNQSKNVDYLLFSEKRDSAFLVELKTDMSSIDPEQKKYLCRAKAAGMEQLTTGIVEICGNSDKKAKYIHLLDRLSKLDLVSIQKSEELYAQTFPKPKRGWSKVFRENCSNADGTWPKCEVVYIQPDRHKDDDKDGFEHLYFNEVADVVQGHGELGVLFANYLRSWTEPAGERNPAEIAHYR